MATPIKPIKPQGHLDAGGVVSKRATSGGGRSDYTPHPAGQAAKVPYSKLSGGGRQNPPSGVEAFVHRLVAAGHEVHITARPLRDRK